MAYEVIVVGGGASGMIAALTAAEKGKRVLLLEKNDRLGKKLSATGNGRGNISNISISADNYRGADPNFVIPALSAFGVEDTRRFFASLGVIFRQEEGRIYPASFQASSVSDCLRFALEKAGVQVRTGFTVEDIVRGKGGFSVKGRGENIFCSRLIMAAGGEAAPVLGGSARGYKLLEKLGHSSSRRFPALVQLKTDNTYPRAMQGLKLDARIFLLTEGKKEEEAFGEVLFTEYGISGNGVFAISRQASAALDRGEAAQISLDLLPDISHEVLTELLYQRRRDCGHLTLEHFFAGLLHKKLGIMICKYAGLRPLSREGSSLEDKELQALTDSIKDLRLPLIGTTGFANAQVTAGGIYTDQVDPHTMGSLICPGLYITGELLDIDGLCGGYNLQWAWSSGHLAGCLL